MFRTKIKHAVLPKGLAAKVALLQKVKQQPLQQLFRGVQNTTTKNSHVHPLASTALPSVATTTTTAATTTHMSTLFSFSSSQKLEGFLRRATTTVPATTTTMAAAAAASSSASVFTLWRRNFQQAGNNTNNTSSNGMMPLTPSVARRFMQVRGKEENGKSAEGEEKDNNNTSDKKGGEEEGEKKEEEEGKAKAEGEEGEENASKNTAGKKKKKKQQAPPKKKTIMDHIRGLRNDYYTFPDIYNSANLVNFIVFTVFCLCSTGSNSEEAWWLSQWGLDETFKPWTWPLHSFLTNNFLSMTYAMMLLHTMCHAVQPTIGSQNLLLFVLATATISGALMWACEAAYYYYQNHYAKHPAPEEGDAAAEQQGEKKHNHGNKRYGSMEKQFGPWDVVAALFVMEYTLYKVSPVTILNSFNGWVRYACWVGELCILYFDWQPTVAGTLVGYALIKGVPRFRGVKVPGAGK